MLVSPLLLLILHVNIMRIIFKYILYTILAIVLFLLLLPTILYIPAVQQGMADYATQAASEQLGMQIDLEKVRIRFPLDIELTKALVVKADGDTMLQCNSLVLDLNFRKIFRKEIIIDQLTFERTKFHYVDSAETFNLKVNVEELGLMARPVNLRNESITLPDIMLRGGDVTLHLVSEVDTTKTASSPLNWIFEVSKLQLEDIHYTMTTKPHETSLQSGINNALLTNAVVDLGKQNISLSNADIDGALCKYLSAPATSRSDKEEDLKDDNITKPWVINLDTLSLLKSNVTYGELNYLPVKYFDPSYISIHDLNINADNIYNKAEEVVLNLNHLSFVERSGFRISHLNTALTLDSSKVALQNLYLTTNFSTIKGNVNADASILKQNQYANITANVNASLSLLDAPYFLPSISETIPLLPTNVINASLKVDGYMANIHLKELSLSIPDNAQIKMSGDIAHLTDGRPLKARLNMQGELIRGALLQSFIAPKDSSSIIIPDNIALNANIDMRGDSVTTNMNICVLEGSIALNGGVNIKDEKYNMNLLVNKFPLNDFLKDIHIGDITTTLKAEGEKFNPLQEGAKSKLSMELDTLLYNQYSYDNIYILLSLSQGNYYGSIVSGCKDALLSLGFKGILTEKKQSVDLQGDISKIDFQALNLIDDKLSVSSTIDFSASADTIGIYSLKGGLGTTTVRMFGAKRTLPGLDIDMLADTSMMRARVEAKGLFLDFFSPQSLNSFISAIDSVTLLIDKQSDSLKFDMEDIRRCLPLCNLSFNLQDNPIISALLKRNGITLNRAMADISVSENKPLYLKSDIYGLSTGNMSVDSLDFNINQKQNALDYNFEINGIKSLDAKGGSIKLFGTAQDNIISLSCLQSDDNQDVGFDFKGELSMLKEEMKFELVSPKPIMGYREFDINEDNFIKYTNRGKIDADFILTSGEKQLALTSKNDTIGNILFVKMANLNIGSILKLWPLAPPIDGDISSDMGINLSTERFGMRGNMTIESLSYDKNLVGDINLKAGYKALTEGGQQVLMALNINNNEVVKLGGKYEPGAEQPMKLRLMLQSLPFAAINPFIPSDMASLTGALNGEFSVSGNEHDIKMNGYLQFKGVDVTLPMIGTSFTMSEEKITMTDNTISTRNFGISGPNKQPMIMEGTIRLGNVEESLADIGKIQSDILITATNFQLVDVKKNNKTLVYGKAFSDMFLVAQGYLNNLMVGGNVALLNGSELTYTLRDGGMSKQEDVSDLVTFTAFTDTLNQDEIEMRYKPQWGVDMSIGVSIGQAVKVAMNLSPDAKSGIDIQGGGELLYTMNMLGDTQFTGRYSITSGTVRYSLPVVATKVFNINQGSYIEWNGDIADPTLNITAQNKVRATVTENGTSNMVNFYVGIDIKNRLEDLDLTFDLSAPENMTITNELASMSEDQRSEQALSMLLYNTYTGVSSTESNFDANSALGSFLSKELNQWANKTLKNVDLSFGVDSYKNTLGETSLDYSYEFSKSLFNDRFKVAVGGSYNPDLSPNEVAQSILGDVSLEYQLDSRDNMLLKIFRSSTNDILEGNISEYGVGFAVRKQVLKLKELFEISGRKLKKAEKKSAKNKKSGITK